MGFLSECTSGGCGAKIGPDELADVISALPRPEAPNLLIGYTGADDAAVYRIGPDLALVSTVDFFSPMVDDPYVFGQIAAANALSDVYAMGGTPLVALNLVCFPQSMDKGILREILAGGAAKCAEADTAIGGGHSIYDHEPKYGLAVTGRVHPGKILRNTGCLPGDALILTKPLGVGLVTAAMRVEMASPEQQQAALETMARLNRAAAGKMAAYPVHACTDVTGFGLAAHGEEMAGEDRTLVFGLEDLPLLPGALDFAREHLATAAGQRNRNHMAGKVSLQGAAPAMQEIVFDPQTSGGLLISLPAAQAPALLAEIQQDDPAAAIVGTVAPREAEPVIFV